MHICEMGIENTYKFYQSTDPIHAAHTVETLGCCITVQKLFRHLHNLQISIRLNIYGVFRENKSGNKQQFKYILLQEWKQLDHNYLK